MIRSMKAMFCAVAMWAGASNMICAEVYDDFGGKSGTWAIAGGTSPNGKWTYATGANPDWAPIKEDDGTLWFCSVQQPGHRIESTTSWDMPTQPGESLTLTVRATNFEFNKERGFCESWIEIVGDAAPLGVYAGWANANWHVRDQADVDTNVNYPNDMRWDTVKITFYRSKTNAPMWQVRITRGEKTVYEVDRPLEGACATNTMATLALRSTCGRVRYDFVDVTSVRLPESQRPERRLIGKILAPDTIFRGETLVGTYSVGVRAGANVPGAIYLRCVGDDGFMTILNSRFVGRAGTTLEKPLVVPAFKTDRQSCTLELIHRTPATGRDIVLAKQPLTILPQRKPRAGENVVANASFELPRVYLGTPLGYLDALMLNAGWEGVKNWTPLADAGEWWSEPAMASRVRVSNDAHSGKQSLELNAQQGPANLVSGIGPRVSAGRWTLSAYVKTTSAEGTLSIDLVNGVREAKQNSSQARASVALPANASQWTRVSVSVDSPGVLMPWVRVDAGKGVVLIDDVQVECGGVATAFNVRAQEFLRIAIDPQNDATMPKWLTSDATMRQLTIVNDSRLPLKGKTTLTYGPWKMPQMLVLGQFDAATLPCGQSKRFEFSTSMLRADGYVASVKLETDGHVVADGVWDFDASAYTNFGMGNPLHSRSVARFVIVPKCEPMKMFGIANTTMVKTGGMDPRSYLEQHQAIREIGLSCIRGGCDDNETFMSATVGGVPIYAQTEWDTVGGPASPPANPCNPGRVDVYDPKAKAYLEQQGKDLGRYLGSNPVVAGVQIANEQYWAASGVPFPTAAADAAFREWCRKKHNGDLSALNSHWGTKYTDWSQVDQVISESFHKKHTQASKAYASGNWSMLLWAQNWPKEAIAELDRLPGKTMDWLRWRTESSIDAVKVFCAAAKKEDSRTLYGTDLPIPAFFKEYFIPYVRATDAVMSNLRYTGGSGYEVAFTTPHECMMMIEMAESLAREENKPFWGVEIYYKPFWPAESIALQNWGLIAHGMSVPMIFAWYPKTDRAPINGVLAWEERRDMKAADPFEKACWYIVDADGAHLPAYDSYVRSAKEVTRYHQAFDGLSIHRAATNVAYYISNDTCEYGLLISKSAPWGSMPDRACYTLSYLLRMAGVTADIVDDATLPNAPGRFQTIVVPYSPVLSQSAAMRLAEFAKAGGTVVLVGLSGQMDPWLSKYPNVGGAAWVDLNWTAPKFAESFSPHRFGDRVTLGDPSTPSGTELAGTKDEKRDESAPDAKVFRGTAFGTLADAEPIHDTDKKCVGYAKAWGKGRLIAYGICPDVWTGDPHITANMAGWTQQLINVAKLPITGRWLTESAKESTSHNLGEGLPAVDLVVREKSANEKFVFALNQGGAGVGTIEIPVDGGEWQATDVIANDAPIEGRIDNGVWRSRTTIEGLGYRVLRLARK